MRKIFKTITAHHGDKHYRSACIASDFLGNRWVFSGFGETNEEAEKDAEDKFKEKDWSKVGKLL
jgi:hypothetical protein